LNSDSSVSDLENDPEVVSTFLVCFAFYCCKTSGAIAKQAELNGVLAEKTFCDEK